MQPEQKVERDIKTIAFRQHSGLERKRLCFPMSLCTVPCPPQLGMSGLPLSLFILSVCPLFVGHPLRVQVLGAMHEPNRWSTSTSRLSSPVRTPLSKKVGRAEKGSGTGEHQTKTEEERKSLRAGKEKRRRLRRRRQTN